MNKKRMAYKICQCIENHGLHKVIKTKNITVE